MIEAREESQNSARRIAGQIAVLIALSGSSLAAAAEEPAAAKAAPAGGLEEIVVTARKRAESLQETPVSVAAFDESDLELRSVENLTDLGAVTPGLLASSGPSGGSGGHYFIRGIGQADWIASFEPGVGVYVDGVYLGRVTGAALDLTDLSRIEVLRGPQGTLFGRNTIGGAINIVSAEPARKPGLRTELTFGEREHYGLKGYLTGPLNEAGTLSGRLSVLARTQDGYGRRLADGGRNGDLEILAARPSLRWEATERTSVTLAGDVSRQRGTGDHVRSIALNQFLFPGTTQYLDTDSGTSWGQMDTPNDKDTWGVSVTLDHEFSESLAVKSISAYRSMRTETAVDFDGTPLTLLEQGVDTDQHQFSQELQLSGRSFGDRLSWLAGLFYFDERVDQDFFADIIFPGLAVRARQLNVMDNRSVAGFLHGTLALTPALSLTTGVRYSFEEKEQFYDHDYLHQAGSFLPPGTVQPVVPPTSVEEDWDSVTPKASLEYRFNPEVMGYLSYSEGFRSGGFNGRPMGVGAILPFGPEEVQVWELGLKTDLLDRRLRLNAAVFFNKYTDMQLNTAAVIAGTPAIIVGNAGESELKGGELELTALPRPNLLINVGAAYLSQEYTQLDPGVLTGGGLTLESEQPNTPKWQVAAGVQYTHALGGGATLTGRADYSHTGRRSFLFDHPLEYQDGVNLVNARLSYATANEQWRVSVAVTNLLDKDHNACAEDVLNTYGVALAWPARPREANLTIAYSF